MPFNPTKTKSDSRFTAAVFLLLSICCGTLQAHHVLGRPSYSLDEDTTTPPGQEIETQVGDYLITYMIFPAFPSPNQVGRVNLYAARLDDGRPFDGDVTFKIRNDSWLSSQEETLGVQKLDDNVYRQNFVFKQAGDFIVTAQFEAAGEPYVIDFPLRIGAPSSIGPIGITLAAVAVLLLLVNISQRKRLNRIKVQRHHQDVGHTGQ